MHKVHAYTNIGSLLTWTFKMIKNVLADNFGFTKHMLNVLVSFLGNLEWSLLAFKLGGRLLGKTHEHQLSPGSRLRGSHGPNPTARQ